MTVFSRLLRRLHSVSLLAKILGIGAVVAACFGGFTTIEVHRALGGALHRGLEMRARAQTRALAAKLTRPMTVGDLFTVQQHIDRVRQEPDVRYVIVRDHAGRPVAHTFESALPSDLHRSPEGRGTLRRLGSDEGQLVEGRALLVNGHAGSVQLALGVAGTDRERDRVVGRLLLSLGWSAAVGTLLGVGLALVIVRSVRALQQTAASLRDGDFSARVRIYADDELGELAASINAMAAGLEHARAELTAKEVDRRALLARLVSVQEAERRAISRELHDHLGQSLLALLLEVDQRSSLDASECRDLATRIRGTAEEVRQLAWGIRPSVLDDFGLEVALQRHADHINETAELQVDLAYRDLQGPALAAPLEGTLFRLVQEALSNVVRHAGARMASVVVVVQPNELRLLVEDDGHGFDVTEAHAGLGLLSMKERTALLGGRFTVESSTSGTVVHVRVPLPWSARP